MQSWFSGYTTGSFLAESWKTDNVPGVISAILFSIVITIFYESSNYSYHIYKMKTQNWFPKQDKRLAFSLLSVVHTFSVATSYITMLCVMTFNTWILISVIFGSGIGHFVCRPLLYNTIEKKLLKAKEEQTNGHAHEIFVIGGAINESVKLSDDEDCILSEAAFDEISLDTHL